VFAGRRVCRQACLQANIFRYFLNQDLWTQAVGAEGGYLPLAGISETLCFACEGPPPQNKHSFDAEISKAARWAINIWQCFSEAAPC
jgi:hypothetical protein